MHSVCTEFEPVIAGFGPINSLPGYGVKHCINKKELIGIYYYIFVMHIFKDQPKLFVKIVSPLCIFKAIEGQELFHIL